MSRGSTGTGGQIIRAGVTAKKNNVVAVSCLLTGALEWGLIWYPYRALQTAGVGGALASFLTYFVALLRGLFLFRGRRSQLRQSPWMLAALALAVGLCNLGYVLAMIHGEVVRVMLLFYLAPLWTMVLARVLLGEKAGPAGYPIIALSLVPRPISSLLSTSAGATGSGVPCWWSPPVFCAGTCVPGGWKPQRRADWGSNCARSTRDCGFSSPSCRVQPRRLYRCRRARRNAR